MGWGGWIRGDRGVGGGYLATHMPVRQCRQSGADLDNENAFFDELARQRLGQPPHHRFLFFEFVFPPCPLGFALPLST